MDPGARERLFVSVHVSMHVNVRSREKGKGGRREQRGGFWGHWDSSFPSWDIVLV